MTAGPSGSSNGITRIKDWTTSSQPSSEEEEVVSGLMVTAKIMLVHEEQAV